MIHRGDRLAVVGTPAGLDQFERVIGQRSNEDLVIAETHITFRRVIVTEHGVLGQTVAELDLDDRFGVAVTRVTRADLEMSAVPGLRLQFGDQLQIVGTPADLDKAAAAVGNSLKELNETHFIPFFIGIALGVALGTMRLWKAEAVESFDFAAFNHGDYYRAVHDKMASENIAKVLYPNDEVAVGKELRLKQQFFFTSCSLQDMLRIHALLGGKPATFHGFVVSYIVFLEVLHC